MPRLVGMPIAFRPRASIERALALQAAAVPVAPAVQQQHIPSLRQEDIDDLRHSLEQDLIQFGEVAPTALAPAFRCPCFPQEDDTPRTTLVKKECTICLDAISSADVEEREEVLTGCGHSFHRKCIDRWRDTYKPYPIGFRCPTCRQGLTADFKLGEPHYQYKVIELPDDIDLSFPGHSRRRRRRTSSWSAAAMGNQVNFVFTVAYCLLGQYSRSAR